MKFLFRVVVIVCALFTTSIQAEKLDEPKFSATWNVLETVGFIAANKIFIKGVDLTYVPLHFDADILLKDWISLSLGLVYRYENYHQTKSLFKEDGKLRASRIWTNYHELFLIAGPRFSPFKTSLRGLYVSLRAGLGTAFSPNYFNLSALLQPEIGYSFMFGNPGFTLTLGAGVLLNLPFYETIEFAVPWNKGYLPMSPLGVIVHQAIPIVNLGVGFHF